MTPSNQNRWLIIPGSALLLLVITVGATWAESNRSNPFALPKGIQFKGQTLPSIEDLALQAVVEGKTRRIATINNHNYLVGDQVEGRKILDIQPDRVILVEGTQRLKLTLNRPQFAIRVTPAR